MSGITLVMKSVAVLEKEGNLPYESSIEPKHIPAPIRKHQHLIAN